MLSAAHAEEAVAPSDRAAGLVVYAENWCNFVGMRSSWRTQRYGVQHAQLTVKRLES